MDNLIGKTLGQYQIIGLAGRGGMATVYKAFQPSLNRYVAIKVLPEFMAQDEQFVARFRQEALAAARLRHPNILVIHDVGQQGNLHYIAMEYLEGQTLAQMIQRTGGLDIKRAARIMDQIALALDSAHQHGLIHRDIKPANIFIGPDDHVTLMDFGIAKALATAGVTRTGTMVGTPEYMSPEQIEGRTVDHRTDLYSLGVVLYQMLTGYVPFSGETPHSILYAHVNKPPTPPSRLTAFVTPQIEAVVMRSLAKNPAERFASAQEMAGALARAAGLLAAPSEQATLSGRTLPDIAPPPPPKQKQFSPWPFLIGAAALGLVAIIGFVLVIAGIVKLGSTSTSPQAISIATPTPAPSSTAQPTLTQSPTQIPPSTTPRPTPSSTPTTSPTATRAQPTASHTPSRAPSTATPTATPTQYLVVATLTRPPVATTARPAPTVANESRTVTPYSPINGARFKDIFITFKWSGGALQPGETFMVEIIPALAEKKGTCMPESDYGNAGHVFSPPLTDHQWTTDITSPPAGKSKPCMGRIEWRVHVRDAAGNIIQSTPRSYFDWNPL